MTVIQLVLCYSGITLVGAALGIIVARKLFKDRKDFFDDDY